MKGYCFGILATLLSFASFGAEQKTPAFAPLHPTASSANRSQVGSTFSAPVAYEDSFYFVATTGVLYQTDKSFAVFTKLFEGDKQTTGALAIDGNIAYWGDGLHQDKKSNFYLFDLKANKLLKKISLPGHIERPVSFSENKVLIPLGPGGLMAMDIKSAKNLWQSQSYQGKSLHIDSNLIVLGQKVCGATIYDLKGVVCWDLQTGAVLQFAELKHNPKSEIGQWQNQIIGLAMEADLAKSKWDVPSDFYVYNVADNKMSFVKELRGFNFFPPAVQGDEAFITLSTGDFIVLNLKNQSLDFLGQFPEPFINNSFIHGDDYCNIGIMGQFLCYKKTKEGYVAHQNKRIPEVVVGKIFSEKDSVVMPTRMGPLLETF